MRAPENRLLRTTLLAFLGLSAATAAIFACSSDDETGSGSSQDGGVVYQDGGVVYQDGGSVTLQDGGVVYQDGGVAYQDGGFEPYDAGPSACSALATAATPLGRGIYGCGGSVAFADRGKLCKSECRACTGVDWQFRLAPQSAPTRNYWLDDMKLGTEYGTGCVATSGAGVSCGGSTTYTPMRVCSDTQTDPEGNDCNWTGCGLDSRANEHFGGCSGNDTAGTLCCPNAAAQASGCASGTNTETFQNGMVGCAGTALWTEAVSLCAASYHVCSAKDWRKGQGDAGPGHNYWTSDLLTYEGDNGDCTVSTHGGSVCYDTPAPVSPMRVCGAGTAPDPDGNRCAQAGCAYELPGIRTVMGGCLADGGTAPAGADPDAGYDRAGTLCCCD